IVRSPRLAEYGFNAESVVQRSPGLADCVGQPLGFPNMGRTTLKGLCKGFNKMHVSFGFHGLHNPFRVGAPHYSSTQGWPPRVGQPWAALHNPYGVGYRQIAQRDSKRWVAGSERRELAKDV